MREALGVSLSVLCSNIRLYHSSHDDNSYDGRNSNIDSFLKDENWVKFLTERAVNAVVNIQNATQYDKVMNAMDTSPKNGHLNSDSQDDIKWMETVMWIQSAFGTFGFTYQTT